MVGAATSTSFNIKIWVVISVIIETSIILCLVFISYYEFKTYIESDILENSSNYQIETNTILKAPTLANNGIIGFQIDNNKNSQKTKGNIDFEANTDNKYKALKICIDSGILDFKTLSKLGFNFKQISEVINSK